jgi:hypothetical protein
LGPLPTTTASTVSMQQVYPVPGPLRLGHRVVTSYRLMTTLRALVSAARPKVS